MATDIPNPEELGAIGDPLFIVEQALKRAATQSENDQKFVEIQKKSLDFERDSIWDKKHYPYEEHGYEWRRVKNGRVEPHRIIPILVPSYWESSGKGEMIAQADTAFQERFLRELGVLRNNQTLAELKEKSKRYPRYDMVDRELRPSSFAPVPDEPYRLFYKGKDLNIVAGLPGKIEGAYARIEPDGYIKLAISFDVQQRISPPTKT